MTSAQLRKDLLSKAINAAHKTLVAVSRGRLGNKMGSLPVVKLTTTGRKSGQPRTVMLTAPIHGDGRYVLVASKGGDDRDPDWYRNLVADPNITLEAIGGDGAAAFIARTATADEKAELWPRITSAAEGYAAYEERTDRDIPVVLCEPATRVRPAPTA